MASKVEAVKVMVRCRPLNSSEKSKNCASIVDIDRSRKEVIIKDPNEKDNVKRFTYDDVFHTTIAQKIIYQSSAYSIVENVIQGYNGTIFAYGQTGCGKTFSMMGNPRSESMKGIIPRTFGQIMNTIDSCKNSQFLVRVSFLEIYNEQITDLLVEESTRLEIKESKDKGLYVQDLSMVPTKSVEEMLNVMTKGDSNRHTGATAMNKESSRSHSIFTIYLEVSETIEGDKEPKIRAGKLNLVDLAGSERQSKTQASGQRLEEAKKINLSLSALGNVISALVSGGKKHIPYRDSKLTRLLQDSLGGNTKTLMIAAISPADYNYEETLGTLKYATRAKSIKNKPIVNEDPKDAMIKQMAEELKLLKAQLDGKGGLPGPADSSKMSGADKAKIKEIEAQRRQFESEHNQLADQEKLHDDEFNQQRKLREEMERKLAEMQKNIVVGGHNAQHPTINDQEKKEYDEMKHEHELQEQEEERQHREQAKKKAKEEEITDNFDEMSEKYIKMQKVYKQLCRDVRDIEHENMKEREDIFQNVRSQERELDFLNQIMSVLLSKEELQEIENKSIWDDEAEKWKVPNFGFSEAGRPPPRQHNAQRQKPSEKRRQIYDDVSDRGAVMAPDFSDFPERTERPKNPMRETGGMRGLLGGPDDGRLF